MEENSVFCVAFSQGAECPREAVMQEPVPLCDVHLMQVALAVVPDVLTIALRQANSGLTPVTLPSEERSAIIAGAQPKATADYMGGVHGPVVYFLDSGHRVKIGYSTNLRSRVKSLSMQEKDVVLLLQGGLTLERALHATYAKERIDATEWFLKSDRLVGFIDSKLVGLSARQAQKTQRQQRKQLMAPAPVAGAVRRPLADWVTLATPLYRRHAATVGRVPTAPELAALITSNGYGTVKPSRARGIRQATEDHVRRAGLGDDA